MGKLINVAKKSDIPHGKAMAVEVEGKKIALFNVHDIFYAIDDECSHAGGSLSEGEVDGTIVTCPWHGATFEMTTGAALGAPATTGVKSYKVQVEGEDVKIEI